jgi:hypothetical protein
MNIMFTRTYRRFSPFPLVLILLLSPSAALYETPSGQNKSGIHADARSIDNLLKTFYESLSFPEGGQPDWVRFRSLFAAATSPCVRIAGDSVMQMDRESFIAFFGGRIQKGTLKSFTEKEIGRKGEYYGSLAQVFSTYEKRMNLADDGKPIRGINSFQLYLRNGRWWIAAVTWQDESAATPIPPKYLR